MDEHLSNAEILEKYTAARLRGNLHDLEVEALLEVEADYGILEAARMWYEWAYDSQVLAWRKEQHNG